MSPQFDRDTSIADQMQVGVVAFVLGEFGDPVCRESRKLNNAVRALPMCKCPVGEGAKRTGSGRVSLIVPV